MNTKNAAVKIVFGSIIFLFSGALAYFAASYSEKNGWLDYWITLVLFAALFMTVGILVSRIFSISLGFLFSADVLFLYALGANVETVQVIYKAILVAFILVALYFVAWYKIPEESSTGSAPPDNI